MTPATAFDALLDHVREHSLLGSISAVLGWDQEVIMPKKGAGHRSKQLAWLAGQQHSRATDPRVGEWLSTIESSAWLLEQPAPVKANVLAIRHRHERQRRLPQSLVEGLAGLTPLAQRTWAESKVKSDFKLFLPFLEKVIALKQQEARALIPDGGDPKDLYTPLLDEFEPGMTAAEVEALFAGLEPALVALVHKAGARGKPTDPLAGRVFGKDGQRVLCEIVARLVGYDFDGGRLDVSSHPFSSSVGQGDSRITTRYDDDLRGSLLSTMHEVGHSLYEQGLPPDLYGTPVGEARSLGLHESQSRLWENQVGRSLPFWQHLYPIAQGLFRDALDGVSLADFHRALHLVEPTFIRTESDEVTYNLHIVIRFRLEQALLSGDLLPRDLPGAWAEAYQRALGITPPDDRRGCLQDVHWSVGAFGYFPTYTLGNLYSAQLFAAACRDVPGLVDGFASGRFAPLLSWLRDKVHRHGTVARSAVIVQAATGEAPSPTALLAHLQHTVDAAG
jgi:carboxypeptidase Taq